MRLVRDLVLPTHELDYERFPVSKAYWTLVGRWRQPSSLWAALPVAQPTILLTVVFVEGALCSVALFIAATFMLVLGVGAHIALRPQRIALSNLVQGTAFILNAATLMVSGLLVGNPIDGTIMGASRSLAKVQLAVTVVQIIHDASVALYMHRFASYTMYRLENDDFIVIGGLTKCLPEGAMGEVSEVPLVNLREVDCAFDIDNSDGTQERMSVAAELSDMESTERGAHGQTNNDCALSDNIDQG